ncbi:hypothetical protein SCHPADRAFT_1001287 [Schizopora paradoxa]|uniref:Uncharacterized protein n=1 Tax=Schizopora paradoxa TaxID=27342 RepID=A0A0H2R989_9AGAM|nr:hypothetical protein SCHPADRAFT_1001287 [Schizopora paradoxa]
MSTGDTNVLPPELLATVFDHALRSLPVKDRSFQALAYSHVCSSYRQVALNSSRLWTSLSSRGGKGQIVKKLAFMEACVERSKGLPLDAVLCFFDDVEYKGENGELAGLSRLELKGIWVDRTFEWVLLRSAQWRSCSLHFFDDRQTDRDEEYRSLFDFRTFFQHVNAPLLEDISFETRPLMDITSFLVLIGASLAWNVPNLLNITINNTFPIVPSKFCPQLRSLAVNLEHQPQISFVAAHMKLLRSSMKSMTTLSTVWLSFTECSFGTPCTDQSIEMPSVEFVGIILLGCTQSSPAAEHEHSLWRELRKFYFPNAIELNVTVDTGGDELVLWNGHNVALYSLLAPSPAHECRYPSLETMVVTIQPWKQLSSVPDDDIPFELPVMLLPYSYVSTLKHLAIRSTVPHWTLLDDVGEVDASRPPYFELGDEVSTFKLETMAFDISSVDGIVPWVKKLASKMRETGCWDGFSELTVIQPEATVVIPRHDVEHWLENN